MHALALPFRYGMHYAIAKKGVAAWRKILYLKIGFSGEPRGSNLQRAALLIAQRREHPLL